LIAKCGFRSAAAVKMVQEKRPIVEINKIYLQELAKWSTQFGR
jgi:hypothetical protein